MNVFISYSRKDAAFVERLKTALETRRISITIDTESLAFGDDLHEFVERSVRETDLTIAVISRHSLQSVWVIAEALETLMYEHVEKKKRFLPIFIDRSVFDDDFFLEIAEHVNARITELVEKSRKAFKLGTGTKHYDIKRERLEQLRNNLGTVFHNLRERLLLDFSNEKFTENLPKLSEAIAEAEIQCEQVSGRPSRYLAPFQAPPLPQHFVPRPEVTNALKERLLKNEVSTPGILVVSAIHGLGGIGKSTLAAALAYDKEVQQRFPDGILWHTLGQQPEILSMLSAWIQTMRDYDFRPTTVEAASTHLRTLLQDKAVLLVVDDVWNPDHAIHFKVGGPRCQVLITTRRADVADEVGAELHQMDVMTPKQALQLLSARLNRPIDAAEHEEALSLAKAVGYLPLALELAAVRVARGMSWNALQQALKQEVAYLEALEGSARRRRKGETQLEACFNLSLNALRTDDEDAWTCFVWLGVLPEDVQIAAPMAATLWDVTREEAFDILELLWNDALLMPGSPILIGDQEWSSYRLHDILHDIARKLLTTNQPQGLELTFQDAHAALLERYKQRTQDGLWHTLPDDGYIHAHLTWHFQQAGQTEQIHALLREETPEGRNGWYQVCERLGQTAGFLADVSLALGLAEKEVNIGLQCRYVLIIASINSLAKNIPPILVSKLVERGIWNAEQGLTYGHQVPDPVQQVETLIALISCIPDALKEKIIKEILSTIQTIEHIEDQIELIIKISSYLQDPLREEVLKRALELVKIGLYEGEQAELLLKLAPYMSQSLLHEVIVVAQTLVGYHDRDGMVCSPPSWIQVKGSWARIKIISGLAEYFPESFLLELVETIRTNKDSWCQLEILAGLGPYLSDILREQAQKKVLATVQTITDYLAVTEEIVWNEALVGLIPQLAKLGLPKQALTATQTIGDAEYLDWTLSELAPYLSGSLLYEALAISKTLRTRGRTEGFVALIARLAEMGNPEEALREIQITNNWEYLSKIAHFLSESLLSKILTITQEIQHEGIQANIMAGIAPYLSENLVRRAMVMAKKIGQPESSAKVLSELISRLAELGYLEESLINMKLITSGFWQKKLITKLIPYLSKRLLYKILVISQAIEDTKVQADALSRLLPWLAKLDDPQKALMKTQIIKDQGFHSEALLGIAPYLSESLRVDVLKEVIFIKQSIKDGFLRNQELIRLIPQLTDLGNTQEALEVALGIEKEWAQAEALLRVATYLSEPLKTWVLREILRIARAIDTSYQNDIIVRVIPQLDKLEDLEEALRIIETTDENRSQANMLTILATRLAELGVFDKALTIAKAISELGNRAIALAKISSYLPGSVQIDILQEALKITEAIGSENCSDLEDWLDLEEKARALIILSDYLLSPLKEKVLREALAIIKESVTEIGTHEEMLIEVAIRLLEPEIEPMLQESLLSALSIVEMEDRNDIFVKLLPYLPESLLQKALIRIQTMEDNFWKTKCLIAIIPYLSKFLKQSVVLEAVELAQKITETEAQIDIFGNLSSILSELPSTTLLPLWRELIENQFKHAREDCLYGLCALLPVIVKLGGKEAIVELFHAIQDVGRWWP